MTTRIPLDRVQSRLLGSARHYIEELRDILAVVDYETRETIIAGLRSAFCLHCGGPPECQCWNDE